MQHVHISVLPTVTAHRPAGTGEDCEITTVEMAEDSEITQMAEDCEISHSGESREITDHHRRESRDTTQSGESRNTTHSGTTWTTRAQALMKKREKQFNG